MKSASIWQTQVNFGDKDLHVQDTNDAKSTSKLQMSSIFFFLSELGH